MSKLVERRTLQKGAVKPWGMIYERDEKTLGQLIMKILNDEYSSLPQRALPAELQDLLDRLDDAETKQGSKRQ